MQIVNGSQNVQVTDNDLIIYPADQEITKDDLLAMIAQNVSLSTDYQRKHDDYIGNHKILQEKRETWGPDYKLVVNLQKYIVDTFTGFFVGIPPKITLPDKAVNESLQAWNSTNSFQDKLAETSKQVDIYGRSIMFLYQDEDSNTAITNVSPMDGFMVYDDTVAQHPLAFVRYSRDKNEQGLYNGAIYYADRVVPFIKSEFAGEEANTYGYVPAVEFFANEERQGAFDNVETLCDAFDHAISAKGNQVDYFDNAYLKILGLQLPTDENGNVKATAIKQNRMIYSPDADSANAKVEFVGKPDADGLQEHYIDRLLTLIYQISMVPNLSDKEFASNSSGVALRYKLLALQNLAAGKERKFTRSLRQLYRVLFSLTQIAPKDAWQDLSFQFNWNIPSDLENEAQTAQTLMGVTSHETAMKPLSVVDDPAAEMQKIRDEQAETVRNAVKNSGALTDQDKADDDDAEEE